MGIDLIAAPARSVAPLPASILQLECEPVEGFFWEWQPNLNAMCGKEVPAPLQIPSKEYA